MENLYNKIYVLLNQSLTNYVKMVNVNSLKISVASNSVQVTDMNISISSGYKTVAVIPMGINNPVWGKLECYLKSDGITASFTLSNNYTSALELQGYATVILIRDT